MQPNKLIINVVVTLVFLVGCGQEEFIGQEKTSRAAQGELTEVGEDSSDGDKKAESTATETQESSSSKDDQSNDGNESVDESSQEHDGTSQSPSKALATCIEIWKEKGNFPFTDEQIKNARTVTASSALAQFAIARDTKVTAEPELVMFTVLSSVAGDVSVSLENPNGWYCLEVNAALAKSLTIEVHCDAQVVNASITSTLHHIEASEFVEAEMGDGISGTLSLRRKGCE